MQVVLLNCEVTGSTMHELTRKGSHSTLLLLLGAVTTGDVGVRGLAAAAQLVPENVLMLYP